MRRHTASYLLVVLAGLLLGAPAAAIAGGTRIWELAGFDELDKGQSDGTRVTNRGEVELGLRARRLDLAGVGLVWCAVKDKAGRVYLGTGYDGAIYRIDGQKPVQVATTGELVITAMAFDANGDLYAGALPDAVILKIGAPDKIPAGKPVAAEKWATLPESAKHVWSLAFGADGKTIFAGTGPAGDIFAVGRDGKASVYLDTKEEHILAIALDPGGRLLAGTSPGAQLLRVEGPGRAAALADFDGTEVRAIRVYKDEIFAAVNAFKIPPAVPAKPKTPDAAAGMGYPENKGARDPGDANLYRLLPSGPVELVWQQKRTHVVSLAVTDKGQIFAGLGAEGKVISVDRDRVVRTELDLDERQAMALLADKGLELAATGDAGSVYTVAPALPAEAVYTGIPLDAGAVSRFGRVKWYARGKLRVSCRSGNTAVPDDRWSDWSKPVDPGAPVPSPAARYLQLRFSFADDRGAALVSVEVAYRRLNQRAVITELNPDSPFPASRREEKPEDGHQVSTRTAGTRDGRKGETALTLSWKVDNPDGDALRYRLWYRALGQDLWRPITKDDEVLKAARYVWETRSIPEGRYQIRLLADDSPDNDPRETLGDEFLSVPILVDNHQPAVARLAYAKGAVSGLAEDGFSEIAAIEFEVDTGPWMPVLPEDGVFDQLQEAFSFRLPEGLAKGPHAVAVRAFDRAGNMGSQEILITAE